MSKELILITGGAGYIGSHTIISLMEMTDFEILSVDNYSNSSEATYKRIEAITGKAVPHLEADIADKHQVEELFLKYPNIVGVIHFAAYKSVPESVTSPEAYYRNNLNCLINILEVGKKYAMKHVIFSSSCSVYGNISTLPVNESTPFGITESPYAFTKLVGEKLLEDVIEANKDMFGISLRYFNPVGAHPSGLIGELPNQRPNNLVPVITQNAIGKSTDMKIFGSDYPTRDGTCIRDYIHVCDIAEAHVLALRHVLSASGQNRYTVFNLGSGNGVTVLEAVKTFERTSGIKLKYEIVARRPGDVAAIYSDSTKSRNELQWEAKRTLDEMMISAWKWEQYLAKTTN